MIICYGMAHEQAVPAARLYALRFPQRAHFPDAKVITRCLNRVRDSGNVLPNRRGNGRPRGIPVAEEEMILDAFADQPRLSTRRAARLLGTTRTCIHRTLRRENQHCYRYRRVQQLLPRDHEPRMIFCTSKPNFVCSIYMK